VRLLFVNQRLEYTSSSSYTLDLALALKRAGDEVQACTLGGDLRKAFLDLGLETYLVKFNLFSYRKLLEFLREFQPDLIHIQNNRSAGFGQRIARKLGLAYVLTVHRVPDERARSIAHDLLAGVIAANEVIRESLVNNHGIPKSLIRVIHHGVDVDALAPEHDRRTAGPGSGLIPVVGSVGRLSRVKGHHIFIEAARRVLDRGTDAMFAIVGEGEEEKGLRRLAQRLGLEKKVTFSHHIPGRRELYRIFDIIVVPTLHGGVGLTALEAMSMGKPVVASAVGEILHVIQDGRTGLLVPEGDVEALAARIVDLLANPARMRSLGEEARAYVAQNFALAPMVKATRQFYEDVHRTLRERRLAGRAPAAPGV
jgi:glycosyltransferase involved in cell wall biosynthesis